MTLDSWWWVFARGRTRERQVAGVHAENRPGGSPIVLGSSWKRVPDWATRHLGWTKDLEVEHGRDLPVMLSVA